MGWYALGLQMHTYAEISTCPIVRAHRCFCCRCCCRRRFLAALRLREEGCLMALLRHEPSQRHLLAVSTHLFWNP